MKIIITKKMIDEAVFNANEKLELGTQTQRVYNPKAKQGTYYMNNIIGELGELVFKKALLDNNYKLGADLRPFGTFMNSDTCDFITSKTAQSIDIKTVTKENNENLVLSKKLVDWKPSRHYVLIQLLPTKKEISIDSIYDITHAVIHGFVEFKELENRGTKRVMYNKEIYFIRKEKLSPVTTLFEEHFFKGYEKIKKYYSQGKIEFHVASLEKGSLIENNKDVDIVSSKYNNKERRDGHYNFYNIYLKGTNKIVSFSIHKDEINLALLAKSLLSAEERARELKCTLVVPDYIEHHLPKEDKYKIVKLIRGMKCNLEFAWTTEYY